ncbi:MAG: tetratricopeptide repeat protein [Planctomycetes bacterium]|nr:tetratricopeptide repeat protein [Planctomycetota bacterium]
MSRRSVAPTAAPAAAPPGGSRRAVWPFVLVAGVGLIAYQGTWHNEFVFDDLGAIEENVPLLAGDWWHAAFGPLHQPLANRPLACLTLVVDFALFGQGPFGPHLTNLLLHLGNALLLFAALRRTLQAPNLAGRFDGARATWLAAIVGALWVAHPLGVDAVAYATQRSTLLFSGCLLLALYATVRAHASPAAVRWRALAVAATALGMASKEDMVAAPVLLVLFERAFLLPDWRALRARVGYHAALAATWLVLGGCLWLGPSNATVGYDTNEKVTAWQWLLTQSGVVLGYLWHALVPYPLRGAYGGGVVRDFGDALLPGAAVLVVLGVTLVCWRRRPWWGWLGALFFLLLAPTSTVMPIVTEIVAERRAYLPMLFVLVAVVLGADRLLSTAAAAAHRWLGVVAAGVVLAVLVAVTRQRVQVYATEYGFWADAYAKLDPTLRTPLAAQIFSTHGAMLSDQGRFEAADPLLRTAMECEGPGGTGVAYYAVSLQRRGRHAEGIDLLRKALAIAPDDAFVAGSLGTVLIGAHLAEGGKAGDPRVREAEDLLRRALATRPRKGSFWNSLGLVLRQTGRFAEAEAAFRRAIEFDPKHTSTFFLRAEMLERIGRAAEIRPMFEDLVAARPRDAALRVRLAQVYDTPADRPVAMRLLQEALRLEPGNREAAALLRQLQASLPR